MRTEWKPKKLSFQVALIGAAGLILRFGMYVFGMDEKGLIPVLHPLKTALYLVAVAAAAWIFAAVRKEEGSGLYAEHFAASLPSGLGHVLAAAGILSAVLLQTPTAPGILGLAWKGIGILAAPLLVWAGFDRVRGKQPYFLTHLTACVFFMLHVINHYQLWSGDPQLVDYVFQMAAVLSLMFFGFYQAAFDLDRGDCRKLLGSGLLAGFLCILNLYDSAYPLLYLGCAVWSLTGLCGPALPESE